MTYSTRLSRKIEAARQDPAFRNYLIVRDAVLAMFDEELSAEYKPSNYWQEELAGFDYMLDASPLIIQKLREHCYHITGLRSYEYREHHVHRSTVFAKKIQELKKIDQRNLLIPESPLLGGFGFVINNQLINLDTLKFYECLIALDKAGVLSALEKRNNRRNIVIEIGAGWGGFPYQFKSLLPNTSYIIIDLPQTLLFSGVYLKTLFPEAKIFLYGEKPVYELSNCYEQNDFILLPHFFLDQLDPPYVDLAINIASFQEMTSEQVGGYIQKLVSIGCSTLYSLNRDRSAYNDQLSSVSSIIQKYYDTQETVILDVPYTTLPEDYTKITQQPGGHLLHVKGKVRKIIRRDPPVDPYLTKKYRHLVGKLR